MKANPLNAEILQIWDDHYAHRQLTGQERMPLLYSELNQGGLLFIGINPSFSIKGTKSLWSQCDELEGDPEQFFAFSNRENFCINQSLILSKKSKEGYPYFNKFKALAKEHNLPWEHIDLFQIRETNQKIAKKLLLDKDKEPNKFAEAQLKIAEKLIEQVKPKAIVVANALASHVYFNRFKPKKDKELGCHIVSIMEDEIPVFFSSMLTGQRALDNFSFERLSWHIGYVLEKWYRYK